MASVSAILRFILRSGKRIAVTIAGALVILAGLVMLVTPGPGVVLILAGLALLATQYAWAETMLDRARERAKAALERARGRRAGGRRSPTDA